MTVPWRSSMIRTTLTPLLLFLLSGWRSVLLVLHLFSQCLSNSPGVLIHPRSSLFSSFARLVERVRCPCNSPDSSSQPHCFLLVSCARLAECVGGADSGGCRPCSCSGQPGSGCPAASHCSPVCRCGCGAPALLGHRHSCGGHHAQPPSQRAEHQRSACHAEHRTAAVAV